jgi:hypothetical protein
VDSNADVTQSKLLEEERKIDFHIF